MKVKFAFMTLTVLLLFVSCKKDTECVEGNNDFLQETRTLDPYNSVQIYGDASCFFSIGTESRVDIFAESNIIPLITTTVNDQKILSVSLKNDACYHAHQSPEVTLVSPDCSEFSLYGSGDFTTNTLIMDSYEITIQGSGNVNSLLNTRNFIVNSEGSGNANFGGNTVAGHIFSSGSGNVYAGNVTSDTCYVISEGSGNITVRVMSYLNVTIKGSGNVYYSGDPDIDATVTGSGQLIQQGK